jgi:hypothetical protein
MISEREALQKNIREKEFEISGKQEIIYGIDQQTITQTACSSPPIQSIFFGGIGYGSQESKIIQTVCTY